MNNWNSLPEDIVKAPCLNTFKARLDRYWRDYLYEEKPIVPSLKRRNPKNKTLVPQVELRFIVAIGTLFCLEDSVLSGFISVL